MARTRVYREASGIRSCHSAPWSTPNSPGWRRLAGIVFAALGLHAALLSGLANAPSDGAATTFDLQTTPIPAAPAMSVRLVPAGGTERRASATASPSAEQATSPGESRIVAPVETDPVAAAAIAFPARSKSLAAAARETAANRVTAGPSAPRPAPAPALPASPPANLPDSPPQPVSATRPVPAPAPSLPPAPDYVGTGQLDPGPIPLAEIEPVYPDAAGLHSGSVVLRLLISESGEVDDVAVVRSSPKGLFEASALAAFGSAHFMPGKVLGLAVKSQITVEVQFTPINRGSTVSGRSY